MTSEKRRQKRFSQPLKPSYNEVVQLTWKVPLPKGEVAKMQRHQAMLTAIFLVMWIPLTLRRPTIYVAPSVLPAGVARDHDYRAEDDAMFLRFTVGATVFVLASMGNVLWFWRRNWPYWDGTARVR